MSIALLKVDIGAGSTLQSTLVDLFPQQYSKSFSILNLNKKKSTNIKVSLGVLLKFTTFGYCPV